MSRLSYQRTQPFLLLLSGIIIALLGGSSRICHAADEAKGLGDPGKPVKLTLHAGLEGVTTLVGRDAAVQLIATVEYDSGQQRDHSATVNYKVAGASVLVSSDGYATANGNGVSKVTATGPDGLRAEVEIAVERFENPPLVNFADRVTPVFTKLSCNSGGCHGKSGGQNGFALSLLGFEPEEDYAHLVKEGRGRRLFPAAPDRSLLLLKGAGKLPHGGGVRMEEGDADYRIIRLWIAQGMPAGSEDDPVLQSVSVFPQHRKMPRNGKQQLQVTAHYSDSSTRDVTRQAQYTANNTDMAVASQNGLVTMQGVPGDVAVMVRFQGHVAAFRAMAPLGAPINKLPPARNFIDNVVFKKLQVLGMPPSELSTDSVFLRRVTIDIAGRLPTYEEAVAFHNSKDANKRAAAIDRLLEDSGYSRYFAQKWGAILRNKVEPNVSRGGNYRFHDWIRTSLRTNMPYSQFVRNLVTASGDVYRNPAVNWHRHVKTVNEKVEDTAQVFLGVRIQCARCHHHPFEKWSQHDYWSLAAFYANVREKNSEFIYAQRGVPRTRHPRTNESIAPASLGGEPIETDADTDARHKLADWMTSADNPFVAKALVNRYWKHFFGRGIVDPEDDMRATNPPSNPELLDALAKHFVDSGFDLKQLIRTICNSSTYQLSARPNEYNQAGDTSFARFAPRRMNAEVLLDSIDDITGASTRFAGLPQGARAVQIPDHGGVNNFFLSAFGRPAGGSACECERTTELSMAQTLHLLNSTEMYSKLESTRSRELAADKEKSIEDRLNEISFRAYSRPATQREIDAYTAHLETFPENNLNQGFQDILWTVVNTKEFMFNH